jgi:hypothetical protein
VLYGLKVSSAKTNQDMVDTTTDQRSKGPLEQRLVAKRDQRFAAPHPG